MYKERRDDRRGGKNGIKKEGKEWKDEGGR